MRNLSVKCLTLSTCLILLASSPVIGQERGGCVAPPPGMIGWWALDDTSGSTAVDLTGYMSQPFNDGTTQQGALGDPNSPEAVVGIVDGAFRFDSINDYVEIPHDASLNLGMGDFTLDMWVYAENTTPDQMPLFSKFDVDRGFAFSLLKWSATEYRIQLQLGDGTVEFLYSLPFVLTVQTWTHLAVVVDRTTATATFYLDGAPHGTDTITTTGGIDSPGPAYIARHPDITSVWLTGIIDEVELFNRALSAVEVAGIAAAGSDGKCKPATTCVAPPSDMLGWWPLDETAGSTAIDLTGFLNQPFNDGITQQGPLGDPASPEAAAGVVDGAFRFDAEEDYVSISHHPSLNVGADDFTVDLWFYREEALDMMPFFSKMGQGAGFAFALNWIGGNDFVYRLDLDNGTASQMILGPVHTSPDNAWIHAAAVVDRQNAEARFYVNGALQGSVPITLTGSFDNTDRAYIAYDPNFELNWFTGRLDEVQFIGRALSDAEIHDIANAWAAGKCKPDPTSTEPAPGTSGMHELEVYPNPSVGQVSLSFKMPVAGDVTVTVYDVTGRLVATHAAGTMAAGPHEISLPLAGLPAGVYVIRLADAHGASVRTVTITR